MTAVQDRCAELLARLEKLEHARDREARAAELEQRRAELEACRIALLQSAAPAQVLRAHDHLPASELPDCTKALESCSKVGSLVDADPTSITKGRDYSYLLKRVSQVTEALKRSNQKSWEAVLAHHQGVDEGFLRRVEAFPGQAERVARIRELLAAYSAATADVPASEEAYARFESCYAELQKASSQLDPDAFPEDVRQFFRKAQSAKGAPLELFTESVREWLQDNDLLDGVRVRFTGEG